MSSTANKATAPMDGSIPSSGNNEQVMSPATKTDKDQKEKRLPDRIKIIECEVPMNIPKLKEGPMFRQWALRVETYFRAHQLDKHIKSDIMFAEMPYTTPGSEAYEIAMENLRAHEANDARVKYIMESLMDNDFYLTQQVITKRYAYEAWTLLTKAMFKSKDSSVFYLVSQLQTMQFTPDGNIKDHCSKVNDVVNQLKGFDFQLPKAMFLLKTLSPEYRMFIETLKNSGTDWPEYEEIEKRLISHHYDYVVPLMKSENGNGLNNSAYIAKKWGKNNTFTGDLFHSEPQLCGKCGKMAKHKTENCYHPYKSKEEALKDRRHHGKSAKKQTVTFVVDTTANKPQASHYYEQNPWIIDSGASCHMTGRIKDMTNYLPCTPVEIETADGSHIHGIGRGNVTLQVGKDTVTLKNVMYIPELTCNLISLKQYTEENPETHFFGNKSGIKVHSESGKPHFNGLWDEFTGVYVLYPNKTQVALKTSIKDKQVELWHRRLGHISLQRLKALNNELVQGMPKLNLTAETTFDCDICNQSKSHRLPFPKEGATEADRLLEVIESDVFGPMPETTIGGKRYGVTFTDRHSKYTVLYLIAHKSDVLECFKEYEKLVSNTTGASIKILRCDNGGEYTSHHFNQFCKDKGIQRQFTTPYTPEQNGTAERLNRTLNELMLSLMLDANAPPVFWGEAICTAVFIKNRTPTASLKDKTPYEVFHGHVPKVNVFGCKAFAHIPAHQRDKLKPKAVECTFIGYDPQRKAFRLWNPLSKAVIISRDVRFIEEETGRFITDINGKSTEADPVQVRNTSGPITYPEINGKYKFAEKDTFRGDNTRINTPVPTPQITIIPEIGEMIQKEVINIESDHEYISENDEQAEPDIFHTPVVQEPARERSETPVSPTPSRSKRVIRPPKRFLLLATESLKVIDEDPTSIADAMKQSDANGWLSAMESEMESLASLDVFQLSELPRGRKPTGCKWVFKLKETSDPNEPYIYKARLVAKGYSQIYGIDYDQTFSPVVRYETIRVLLAIAAAEDWEIHQMDVKTAFLNGTLEEELYMEQAPGFVTEKDRNLVYKLKKSIYGLKQSARVWNSDFDASVKKLGFKQMQIDKCVYRKDSEEGPVILAIYVDDILIFGSNMNVVNQFKIQISNAYKMKDMGEIKSFLGIEITRDRSQLSIFVSQHKYLTKVLNKFGMFDCNPAPTPLMADQIPHLLKLKTDLKGQEPKPHPLYRSAIGSLIYAMVVTRPDIAFAVSFMSRFNEINVEDHWTAVKRILRYIKHTLHVGLFYQGQVGNHQITGYCDADLAGDITDSISTSGYLFLLSKGPIAWNSQKQSYVSMSTMESEYVSASEATKECIFLQMLTEELGFPQALPMILNEDNQSMIKFTYNSNHKKQSKHIRMHYHNVRHCCENGEIKLVYCKTEDQLADHLTKALAAPTMQHLCKMSNITTFADSKENTSSSNREC